MKIQNSCRPQLAGWALVFIPALGVSQETGSPGQTAGPTQLEEVVVTTQKRSETLQDVPIAVTAFSAETLREHEIVNLEGISQGAPNLNITKNQTTANSAQVYIRGVGQDDSTPVNEPGVGIYLDDVYIARSQGGLFDLPGIERVEVLNGPQGTLYGRNSSGGAIRLITAKPSLDTAETQGDVTIGSFDERDLRLGASTPLVPGVLAVKVDASSIENNGYVKRLSDDETIDRTNRQTLRAALRWLPVTGLTVDLSTDYTNDRSGQQAPIPLTAGASLPGARAPLFGYYVSDPSARDLGNYEGWGVAATVKWDLDAFSLKSITAERSFQNEFFADLQGRGGTPASGPASNLFRNLDQNQSSQEFQIVSQATGPLTYVGGLFYLHEWLSDLDLLLIRDAYTQVTDSLAAYGEVSYAFTVPWSVTVGGRVTNDSKEFNLNALSLNGPFVVNDAKKSWTEFTPKVATSYKVEENLLLYASWQRGYKAGAFQGFPQSAADVTGQTLAPEKVDAFETGIKSEFLDQRLRVNADIYYQNYKDLQVAVFEFLPDGEFAFQSADAQARMWGTEFQVSAALSDHLSVYANAGTFSGEYTGAEASVVSQVCIRCGYMKFMPKWSEKSGFTWRSALGSGEWIAGGDLAYTDKVYFSTDIVDSNSQKAHELIDGRLGYESAGKKWSILLTGENLSNVKWASTGTTSGGGSLFVEPPRTWFLRVGTRL